VDLKKWTYVGAAPGEVLRVVHAPSRRGAKGTGQVLSAVAKLKSEGIPVELRLVEKVPNDEAREIYKWADVVIDQLRIGWYGVLAVEAMALGKAVVCYVRDDLKHYLPYPFPMAVANPENVYHILKDLALHPEEVRSLGHRARQYVEELHDAQKVADILLQVYGAEATRLDIDRAGKLLWFEIASYREMAAKLISTTAELASTRNRLEAVRRQLRATTESFSYQSGYALTRAVSKPGRNTLFLPYRLFSSVMAAIRAWTDASKRDG